MGLFLTPQGNPTTRTNPGQSLSEPIPQPAAPQEQNPVRASDRRIWWTSLFILCAVLGALLGLSFKTQDTIRKTQLPSQNFFGLAEEYSQLKQQNEGQQRTIAALQKTTTRLENSMSSGSRQAGALVEDLNDAKFLAGLTVVTGPGLTVTLNDSPKRALDAPVFIQDLNMIHDTDINQTINELKAAGADAISVNNQRMVAMSPVRCVGNNVLVNNTPQTPPYIIRAIGDPKVLQDAMNLPGGEADHLRAQDPDHPMIKLQEEKKLSLPAYSGPSTPKYASPVAVAGAEPDKTTKN